MNAPASLAGLSIHPRRRATGGLCRLVMLALVARVAFAAPAEPSLPAPDDDVAFREALRSRGLDGWLDQYWADRPSSDDVSAKLRRREAFLAEAASAGTASARAGESVTQASAILAELLAAHPEHPDRLRWRLELARDCLERQAPDAFVNVLTYELPGRDVAKVRDLSKRGIDALESLRQEVAETWKSLETLNEASLAIVRDTGSLDALESLDAQSSALLTWARLYQAITGEFDSQQRRAAFARVLTDLSESGRLEPTPGREFDQVGATLIAAVAERRLSVLDQENATGLAAGAAVGEPDRRAREVIAIQARITDGELRRRLRQASLIAVLEQIRAVRDARRYDDALQFAAQAREWTLKSRADEPSAFVAVSLLEATTLWFKQAAEQAGDSRPPDPWASVAWLDCEPCLKPLERVCLQSPVHRDALYRVLAFAAVPWPASESARPFVLQLTVGAAVHGARTDANLAAGLAAHAAALHKAADSAKAQSNAAMAGELQYLLGQALHLLGRDAESVQVLTDLAIGAPGHDRADLAIRQAVDWAGAQLRRSGPTGSPESRAAFVRAARTLRKRFPGERNNPALSYAMAAVLENDGQFQEAAVEYAAVGAEQPQARDAALGRLRCCRLALEAQAGTSSQPSDATELTGAARQALDEVLGRFPDLKSSADPTATTSDATVVLPLACDKAQLLLAAVRLLNLPAIGGAAEAVLMLEGFESRTRACPELLGPALRERILGLRQLKRLTEARSVLDRYLAAEPDRAGSSMAGLLQSMQEEILALLERGDDAGAATVAAEAVQVGESLLAWADAAPGRLESADRGIIRTWYAAALLQAGRPDEALRVSEATSQSIRAGSPSEASATTQADLVRADALLAMRNHADAVALYAEIWQSAPERSDAWWHAFVGSLECHAALGTEPGVVLQSIRQQRALAPDLGGARWARKLTALEAALTAAQATRPG